jgi:tetratricopeptide (TPR) repeat protein
MNSLIGSSDFASLLREADAVTDAEPDSYIGYWWLGRALTLQGRLDEAVRAFYDSIKHAEDDDEESRIMANLASVFNAKKEYDVALDYSEIALELNPGNPAAVLALGVALAATGNKRAASDHISANWGKLRDGYQRACGYAIMGQKDKMLEVLKEDLVDNPHHRVMALLDPEFRPYIFNHEFRALLKNS